MTYLLLSRRRLLFHIHGRNTLYRADDPCASFIHLRRSLPDLYSGAVNPKESVRLPRDSLPSASSCFPARFADTNVLIFHDANGPHFCTLSRVDVFTSQDLSRALDRGQKILLQERLETLVVKCRFNRDNFSFRAGENTRGVETTSALFWAHSFEK